MQNSFHDKLTRNRLRDGLLMGRVRRNLDCET